MITHRMQEVAVRELSESLEQIDNLMSPRGPSGQLGASFEARAIAMQTILRLAPKRSSWIELLGEARRLNRSTDEADQIALETVLELTPIMRAMKFAYEKGHLWNFEEGIRGALFQDELGQAEELLRAGYPKAAAVTAGIVLEAHLRRMAVAANVPTKSQKGKYLPADRINQNLKEADAYEESDRKRVSAWLSIRDSGAHPHEVPSLKSEIVEGMIRDVSAFILIKPA